MNLFSRGLRNAFRNTIRTVAIVGMLSLSIGLSLSMLLAHQAIDQKIESVQKSIGNTIVVSPAGIRGFTGGGDPLTTSQVNKIKTIAHVTRVDQTLNDRLNSENTTLQSSIEPGSFGRRQFRIEGGAKDVAVGGVATDGSAPDLSNFKLPVSLVGTTNPLQNADSNSTLTLSSGQTFDGTKDANVALVGKSLASKNSLHVGSTFTAYGAAITVKGIFDAGNTFNNDQVVMPLPTVQRLSSQTGTITGATVHIDNALNLDGTTTAIKNKLGSAADVTNDADGAKATLSSLENIRNVSMFSLIGAAGTAAVIILLTMIMIVRERRREIGVLKAIGGSNVRVMLQFVIEALTLTVLAAAIGVIIGALAATPVTKMLSNNSSSGDNSSQTISAPGGPITVTNDGPRPIRGGFSARLKQSDTVQGVRNLKANVNGSILLYGFGGALLIASIGSLAAAGLIAKVRPAEVMRAE
ncbi:MAG TPA: FtsX-like permease family protein [Bacillota bacterium]|nr:FtsX-like permease family protein [Bacillota bacterium]